jgi:hypothetical protein
LDAIEEQLGAQSRLEFVRGTALNVLVDALVMKRYLGESTPGGAAFEQQISELVELVKTDEKLGQLLETGQISEPGLRRYYETEAINLAFSDKADAEKPVTDEDVIAYYAASWSFSTSFAAIASDAAIDISAMSAENADESVLEAIRRINRQTLLSELRAESDIVYTAGLDPAAVSLAEGAE